MGATPLDAGRRVFKVWAPHCKRMDLVLEPFANPRQVEMNCEEDMIFTTTLQDVPLGCRYMYLVNAGYRGGRIRSRGGSPKVSMAHQSS